MTTESRIALVGMGGAMALACIAILIIPVTVSEQSAPVTIVEKVTSPDPKFSPKEVVLIHAYRRGWLGQQWQCLTQLLALENRQWKPTLKNPTSTASGIFQVIKSPSGRMFRDYSVDTQAQLGLDYIKARYGTPCNALAFHRKWGYY